MHDTTMEKEIADVLSSRDPGGVSLVSRAALRRLATNRNIIAPEQESSDSATMEEPATAKSDPTAERAPLLIKREQTHGSFADNARVSQAIKDILRAEPGWGLLTVVEREAMDMIALKFSRILSGKSLELQHWEDVVGYAKLAEEQCTPVT